MTNPIYSRQYTTDGYQELLLRGKSVFKMLDDDLEQYDDELSALIDHYQCNHLYGCKPSFNPKMRLDWSTPPWELI